ncbi:hypothetical protein GCM10022393_01000 [Aquimarina addita]|uniref:PKD domain-containing protein n=2 Tax=Aquimarina addita TaxID=870485 RepID=A0ABP7X7S8_9FLAO
MSACVDDDSSFPNDNTGSITSSSSIVTILNKFGTDGIVLSEVEQCFKFVYPITLGYNTTADIRIDSYDGLLSVISSQRTNFNITGLQFPITIQFNNTNTSISIPNETSLLMVLKDCQFHTLRDEFEAFYETCFILEYPTTVFTTSGTEIILSNDEDFRLFYGNQEENYQPLFKFPLDVSTAPDFSKTTIDSYFGFYEVFESCETSCPQIDFTSDVINAFSLQYSFESDFTSTGEIDTFNWFINDVFVGNGISDGQPNFLLYEFDSPGVYNVCLKTESETCFEEVVVCNVIDVTTACPELAFTFENNLETSYTFTADFEGINDVIYQWIVDEVIKETDGGTNGDNIYNETLSAGMHTICIEAMTASCPEGATFCQELFVEECPDLFFEIEQEGNSNTYNFFADFDGVGDVIYEWVINGDFIEQDGGQSGDNTFFFQFDTGTYEICITTETPDCPDGTEFCRELIIP